ncbi:hypothetical protein [Sphingomonas morindae]|uniref:Uncharacterized protein n=1 Tax=Sphingomonas morindae TaxID=1541170 RepID=A0ABY4X7N9_9SPHN|nr:hypothetical protein [Sphingomonas morindae]USI72874.1 hypothetical protein LHA26_16665 [Sphingomonas morindae]
MSSIIDDPAFVWNYDQLQAEGEGASSVPLPELGGPVGQVCPDDLYAGMRITAVRPWGGSCLYTLQQRLFFVDVVEGRVWEELQAA